jgi:HEAT repeat protein
MRALVVLAAASLLGFAQDPASADPKLREKAAKSLAREGSAAIEKLQPLLSDPVPSVRRAAAESIVSIGGPNILEPLTFSLRDGDPQIQMLAANGLVNFYLPGFYQTGWKARIRRSASDWLEHFTGPDDDTEVVPRYVVVRPEIIEALGEVAAASPSMEARATACRALGVLRGRAASEQLLAALATKNTEVLYEVLTAFEKIRNPEVAPKLFYLLRDPEERVQVAAIQTVAVLGNHDAVEPLMEAWRRARNDKIRAVILEALAMLPEESSRPLF